MTDLLVSRSVALLELCLEIIIIIVRQLEARMTLLEVLIGGDENTYRHGVRLVVMQANNEARGSWLVLVT